MHYALPAAPLLLALLRFPAMDDFFGSSCSSASSAATVQHHKVRSFSTNSLSSVGSYLSRRYHGDATPRSSSALNLTLSLGNRRWSGSSAQAVDQPSETSGAGGEYKRLRLVDVAESAEESQPETDEETWWEDGPLEADDHARLPDSEAGTDCLESVEELEETDMSAASSSPVPKAFHRWVSTLRKKKARKPMPLTPRTQRWTMDDFDTKRPSPVKQQRPTHHHKQASYGSSIAFVTAVRSTTATIASASVATVSRRNSKWRRNQESSLMSGSDPRPSMETQRSIMDEAARARSRKRRDKVEELIRTEEGYVADLKALSNVPDLVLFRGKCG